jgi:2-keto-4-pentenoate hydratase
MRYVLLAFLLAAPGRAEWTKADMVREYEACLPACDITNPRDHDKCVSYCHCVTDAVEGRFSSHQQLIREVVEQKLREPLAALQKITNRCNRQIFGNPARKIRIH